MLTLTSIIQRLPNDYKIMDGSLSPVLINPCVNISSVSKVILLVMTNGGRNKSQLKTEVV